MDIFEAIRKEDYFHIKQFFNCGGDPNEMPDDEWSILMEACLYGHLEIVKLLVEAGADIHLSNSGYETALVIATRHRHLDVMKYLIKKGAISHEKGDFGWSAVKNCVLRKQIPFVLLFIKHFHFLKKRDQEQLTGLKFKTNFRKCML